MSEWYSNCYLSEDSFVIWTFFYICITPDVIKANNVFMRRRPRKIKRKESVTVDRFRNYIMFIAKIQLHFSQLALWAMGHRTSQFLFKQYLRSISFALNIMIIAAHLLFYRGLKAHYCPLKVSYRKHHRRTKSSFSNRWDKKSISHFASNASKFFWLKDIFLPTRLFIFCALAAVQWLH